MRQIFMEFYAENANIEPLEKFQKLNEISSSICGFKNNKHFLLSLSEKGGTTFAAY
jgi:para-aminobenzoate synthetase component 1